MKKKLLFILLFIQKNNTLTNKKIINISFLIMLEIKKLKIIL